MKVKNLDVWQAAEPLRTLMAEPWPVKAAYTLAKFARKINEQVIVIDQVRVKLVHQYGTADDKGQVSVQPNSPGWQQFVVAFNELLAEEADLSIEKITLPGVDGVKVPPSALLALDTFVEVA